MVEELPQPEEAPTIVKEATNETVEANTTVPVIQKEATNETVEANKTEVVMAKEVTDEKAKEPEKKPEPKEGYSDEDIADVKFTPRKDDDIDSKNAKEKGPRSPLPGG